MSSAIEKNYAHIKAEAESVVGAKHPGATLIVSFGEGDCIVDVLITGEKSLRYVYIPEDE